MWRLRMLRRRLSDEVLRRLLMDEVFFAAESRVRGPSRLNIELEFGPLK